MSLKTQMSNVGTRIVHILDGSLLVHFVLKHAKFLLLVVFLVFMYIGNRYAFDDTMRQIALKKERISELKDISVTVSGDLMTISRPSKVNDLVRRKGLDIEFAKEPPSLIDEKE